MTSHPAHKFLSISCSLAVCLTSAPALSAPLASGSFQLATAAEPAGSSDYEEAKRLYQEGKVAYQLANYDVAIEKFEQAFALLSGSDDVGAFESQSIIVRNLSLAHQKAFELSKNGVNLQKAQILLRTYATQLENIEPSESFPQESIDKELDKTQSRIAEIEGQLAALEAEQAAANPAPPPEPDPGADAGAEPEPEPEPEPVAPPPPSKPMFIAGGVLLGLGAAGGAVAATGMVMGNNAESSAVDAAPGADRQNAIQSGQTGNILAYVGAAVGGVGLIAGAALMGVAAKRKKAEKGVASPSVSMVPVWHPGGGGVAATVRF